MVGWLAKVLAGHDKDSVCIIIEETQRYVLLADGVTRTVARPKRKNKKHIQIWKNRTEEIEKIQSNLAEGKPVRDEEIKRAIKLVMKNEMEEHACQKQMSSKSKEL